MEVTPVSATADAGIWDPAADTCEQERLEDWTGLDSLVSPVFCLLVLLAVMGIEHMLPGRDLLWYIPRWVRLLLLLCCQRLHHGGTLHHDTGLLALGGDPPWLRRRRILAACP